MREILFKAKRTDNGEWVEGSLIVYPNGDSYICCDCDEPDTIDSKEKLYVLHYENKNVKAYKNIKNGIVIELIRKVFGEPDEIIKNFDFTITKFAYYKEFDSDDDGELVVSDCVICDDCFFEHLHTHKLVIDDKVLYPSSTFERMIKYAKYGFYPCKETKMKILKAINEMDKNMIAVSESLYDGMD